GHAEYRNTWQTIALRSPGRAAVGGMVNADIRSRVDVRCIIGIQRDDIDRHIRYATRRRRPGRYRGEEVAALPDALAGAGESGQTDVNDVVVGRIDDDARHVEIGNHAAAADGIDRHQGGGAIGGCEQPAVAQSDDADVVVIGGDADGRNRNA